jgi:Txe/YoeB family toxin of Txe-Axe toxin-antitoxin module
MGLPTIAPAMAPGVAGERFKKGDPMPWTVVNPVSEEFKKNPKNKVGVPAAAMRKFYDWCREIEKDIHPKLAADIAGDMNYEQLGGKLKGQYTIRLSREHRVAFTIDEATQVVTIFQIGGHYP